METSTEEKKLTADDVERILAATAHGATANSAADAKCAARVMLALKKRGMLVDIEPETQMDIANETAEIVAGVFGGVINSVVRMAMAKSFAEQQREITYLTNKLLAPELPAENKKG